MSLPFELNDAPEDINKEMWSAFPGNDDKYVQAGASKYLLCGKYESEAAGICNLPLKEDDVWIVTFPRSGTTWTQEIVWLINNDLDYERATTEKLRDRFPFIDGSILMANSFVQELVELNQMDEEAELKFRNSNVPRAEKVQSMRSPRHIKTHLPLSLLPPALLDTCKVVYVARNPKDVAVSCYYQNSWLRLFDFKGTFEQYWDLFQRGLVLWAPYWDHVEEAWRLRNHPNLLFLFYEDMKKDLPTALHKVASFLNKSLNDDQIQKLTEHLKIENFRNNPTFSGGSEKMKGFFNEDRPGFFRQGKSGSWRSEFSAELNAKADEWIKEHEKDTDLRFQF